MAKKPKSAPPRVPAKKPTKKKAPAPKSVPEKQISPNDIYEFLIENLELSKEHNDNLAQRGFSPKEIAKLGYRTFPQRRQDIILKMIRHFGQENLMNCECPGLWRNEKGEIQLAGKSGILIPVRDHDGKVSSIKIRVDNPSSPASKYLLLSSNPEPDKKTGVPKYAFGTKANVQVHYPLQKPKRVKILRITEGELKADVATGLTDVYTISIPGVAMWRMAIDAIKVLRPKAVYLAFDADKDKGTNVAYDKKDDPISNEGAAPLTERFIVGKAVSSLYLSIKAEMHELGISELCIEDWPSSAGKGIDDVLVNGKPNEIEILSGETADEFATNMLAEGMQNGWTYVVGVKRFYHNGLLIELDKEQYADRFMHVEKGNPANNALRNAALVKVDYPIYMPNREPIYEESGNRYFNTWRRGTLIPKKGCVKTFLDHMQYMIPDKRERDIMLDWLAFNVQNPGKKILWAILLQGDQGIGKSILGWVMRQVLGEKNVSLPPNELLHEIYTDWQKSCQLVVIEEIMAEGRLELMNKFKPMITQDITTIREMRKPAYTQPNVFNMLMFTNHQNAIIIDKQDRRYCVIFSPAKPQDHKYYKMLWTWIEQNKSQIFYYFMHRDISKFQPLGHAPMTAAKQTMIEDSAPPCLTWMQEAIATEQWPFMGDFVSTAHLLGCLPTHLRFVNTATLKRSLEAAGAHFMGQYPSTGGGAVRLWCVRRIETWKCASDEAVVASYEKWSNASQPGGNPLLDAKAM